MPVPMITLPLLARVGGTGRDIMVGIMTVRHSRLSPRGRVPFTGRVLAPGRRRGSSCHCQWQWGPAAALNPAACWGSWVIEVSLRSGALLQLAYSSPIAKDTVPTGLLPVAV